MIPFVRKRQLNRKQPLSNTLSSSHSSVSSSQDSLQSGYSLNFSQVLDRITVMQENLHELETSQWQKQSSEVFTFLLDSKNSLHITQQLQGYRQSMVLLGRYQQQLKKKSQQLTEDNNSFSLGLLRRMFEEVSRLTQDENNDNAVKQTRISKPIFLVLEGFVGQLQAEVSRIEKRPTMMRKSSLKKIEQLPSIRPSSRGKLTSLSKKDSGFGKQQLLGISKSKFEVNQKSLIEDIVLKLCSIVKNMSANSTLRRELLKEQYLRLMNRYLFIWTDKNVTLTGNSILSQLSAGYRHLAVDEGSHKAFLESNCLQAWARLIEVFPTNQDIIFNVLRTLSKVSNYQSVCLKMNQKKACLKSLGTFFKFYKSNIHIIIRIAIIFANMTSYLSDIRVQLYFDFNTWEDIYECFNHYASRELSGRNEVDKMGLSMAAWDYQNINKESDIDCIIRIIRLIANILTVPNIGQDIYLNKSGCYRQLAKKLKTLLQKKSNLEKSGDLITAILSCLSNLLFYDKEVLMGNQQHRLVKTQLVAVLVDFVVQIDHQQICCESLRVVANITRMKEFCSVVIEAKIHEAMLILLESTSKEIVYYCLGVFSNLMADNNFRQQFKEPLIDGIVSILNECDNDDFDLVTIALKTLATIIEARNQNLDPRLLSDVESCLMNLGSHCDKVSSSAPGKQASELQQSRSLINFLLNSMPEERFVCPVKNCGRRFGEESKLDEHLKRRHKL